MGLCLQAASHMFSSNLLLSQASQLGVYKAFVDNYEEALETAEKCSQANIQFQKISEVSSKALQSYPVRSDVFDVDLSIFTMLEKG